jgi:hypothetical protein
LGGLRKALTGLALRGSGEVRLDRWPMTFMPSTQSYAGAARSLRSCS